MSEPPTFGHFRLAIRPDGAPIELGRGAMGVTYKAYDEKLHIDVALKVITPDQVGDPHSQALFLREARAAARVRHSNVASVLELDDTPGRIFYAMEFVNGQSLKAWLQGRTPLKPKLAIELAIQIARGLEAIHKQGIVHRDLKPANVMMVHSGGGGSDQLPETEAWEVKIIDFGIARATSGCAENEVTATQTTGFRGTALYASPEQCGEEREIDGRSDLYSLGCILWEMLCGSPPFRARTPLEVMSQHIGMPPQLNSLANLPSEVIAVVTRLLMKDAAARYPSATATIKALEDCRTQLERGDESETSVSPTVSPANETSLSGARSSTQPTDQFVRPRRHAMVMVAVAIAAVGLVTWFTFRSAKPNNAKSDVASSKPTSSQTLSTAAPLASRKSVAVLPFENLSSDKENEFFADGVQEDVLTNLARIRDLKVISRTSVMEYRGQTKNLRKIAAELDVGTIVEGTVRRSGNSIRVTVQLIDALTDKHIWAEKYDRAISDVFAVQSEIAESIAAQLKARLSPDERTALEEPPTRDLVAYQSFLRARANDYELTTQLSRLEESIGLLKQALARDPQFFEAWCLLAKQYLLLYLSRSREPASLDLLNETMATIRRLRPNAGETHLEQGRYQFHVERNNKLAAAEFQIAVDLLPNDAEARQVLGDVLTSLGLWDAAIHQFKEAIALDPRRTRLFSHAADAYKNLRRYSDARAMYERALNLAPNSPSVQAGLAMLGIDSEAKISGAKEIAAKLLDLRPPELPQFSSFLINTALYSRDRAFGERVVAEDLEGVDGWVRQYFRGRIALASGDTAAARSAFAEAINGLSNSTGVTEIIWLQLFRAEMLAYLGQTDEAMKVADSTVGISPLGDGELLELQASVLANSGRLDEALNVLSKATVTPGGASYGDLCLDPRWDPLRQKPRFKELVNSLAPKTVEGENELK
jgi:serine/threonine-protein kinase